MLISHNPLNPCARATEGCSRGKEHASAAFERAPVCLSYTNSCLGPPCRRFSPFSSMNPQAMRVSECASVSRGAGFRLREADAPVTHCTGVTGSRSFPPDHASVADAQARQPCTAGRISSFRQQHARTCGLSLIYPLLASTCFPFQSPIGATLQKKVFVPQGRLHSPPETDHCHTNARERASYPSRHPAPLPPLPALLLLLLLPSPRAPASAPFSPPLSLSFLRASSPQQAPSSSLLCNDQASWSCDVPCAALSEMQAVQLS